MVAHLFGIANKWSCWGILWKENIVLCRRNGVTFQVIKSCKFSKINYWWNFSFLTEDPKDLIRKCLVVDPEKRITVSECLKHPFFNTVVSDHDHSNTILRHTLLYTTLWEQNFFNTQRFFFIFQVFIILSTEHKDYLSFDETKKNIKNLMSFVLIARKKIHLPNSLDLIFHLTVL